VAEVSERIIRLEEWRTDASKDIYALERQVYGDGNGTPSLRAYAHTIDVKVSDMITDIKERRKELRGIMITLAMLFAGQILGLVLAFLK